MQSVGQGPAAVMDGDGDDGIAAENAEGVGRAARVALHPIELHADRRAGDTGALARRQHEGGVEGR